MIKSYAIVLLSSYMLRDQIADLSSGQGQALTLLLGLPTLSSVGFWKSSYSKSFSDMLSSLLLKPWTHIMMHYICGCFGFMDDASYSTDTRLSHG